MTEWYRNTDWSPEIAKAFEARIARGRTQKAQHLSLQGHALIARHPEVARGLLERAVATNDEFETPRAMAFLAQAQLALSQVDAALDTYEAALERQLAQPNIIAVQPADYLFLVGYFQRAERLPAAEPLADALQDDGIFGPDPQTLAAKALVYALAGRAEAARGPALAALPLMEGMPDAAALGIDIGELRRRLEALAG